MFVVNTILSLSHPLSNLEFVAPHITYAQHREIAVTWIEHGYIATTTTI